MEIDQKQWDDELDNLALEEFLYYYTDFSHRDEHFIPAGSQISPQSLITTYMHIILKQGARNCYIAQYTNAREHILYSYHPVISATSDKSVLAERLKTSGIFTKEIKGKNDLYFLIQGDDTEMFYLGILGLKARYNTKEFEICQSFAHNIIQAYLRLKNQEHATCLQNRIKELETSVFQLGHQHMLAETSGRVAHEINNFLMSLNGNLAILAEQLEKRALDPEMQNRFRRLTSFSEIVAGLTTHMTLNSELENSIEPLDINQLIQETIDFIRPLEAKRNIEFKLDLSPLPAISLGKARIYQIVLNLCNYLLKNRCDMILIVETLAINDQIFLRFYPGHVQFPHAHDRHAFKNPFYLESDLGLSITLDLVQEQHGILSSYADNEKLGFQVTFLYEPGSP